MTDSSASIQSIEANKANFDLVLDIRPHAGSTPTVSGAVAVTADRLLSNPSQFIGSNDDLVLVVCDIGLRSAIVTDQLRSIGYGSAISLEGGIESWIAAGLPITSPQGLSIDDYARYDRPLKLPAFGIPGQQALASARVAIVGVGGLGSPVLGYLAAAGVGHLTIIDSDNVELSNLHRQPIYTTGDVGRAKSEAAASYAAALNPHDRDHGIHRTHRTLQRRSHPFVATTSLSRVPTASTQHTRSMELRCCSGFPMVFGSVYRTEGQLAVFDARSGPCYACVFPAQSTDPGLDCSIVGVLGPVTGVIGSMQATETIKVVIGSSNANTGALVLYDAESQSIDRLSLQKVASCATCGDSRVPSIRV